MPITPQTRRVWGFVPHTSPFPSSLDTSSPGVQQSIWFSSDTPGLGFRPHRSRAQSYQTAGSVGQGLSPTSSARGKNRALLFDSAMTSGVPTVSTPSLLVSFNSLLELSENSNQMEEMLGARHEGQCAASTLSPGAPPSQNLLVFTKLPSPVVGGFYGGPGPARLSRWPSLQPLSCPHNLGWGEIPNPLIMWSVPLAGPHAETVRGPTTGPFINLTGVIRRDLL